MFVYIKKSSSKVSATRTVSKSSGTIKQEKDGPKRSPLRPLLLVERVLGIDSTPPAQAQESKQGQCLKQSAFAKDTVPRPTPRTSFYGEKKTSKDEAQKSAATKPPFKVSFSVPNRTSSSSRPASQPPTPTVPKKSVAPFVVPLHFKKPSTSSKVVGTGTVKSPPNKSHFFTPPSATASKVSKVLEPRLSLPTSLPASKTASQTRCSLPVPTPQRTAQKSRIPRLRLDRISSTLSTPPKVLSPVSSSGSSNSTSPTTPCPRPAITVSETKALIFPASANDAKLPSTLVKVTSPKSKPDSVAVPAELESVDLKKAHEAITPHAVRLVKDATLVVAETQNSENPKIQFLKAKKASIHLKHEASTNTALVSELKSVLKRVHSAGAQLDEVTRPVGEESPKIARRVRFAQKENDAELQEVFRRHSAGGLIDGRIPFSAVSSNVESSSLSEPSFSPGDSSFEFVNTLFGARKVRRVVVPPLEDGAMASRNPQIQLELLTLRSQKKVQGGGEKLNCAKEGMSLYSLAIVQKNRKSI